MNALFSLPFSYRTISEGPFIRVAQPSGPFLLHILLRFAPRPENSTHTPVIKRRKHTIYVCFDFHLGTVSIPQECLDAYLTAAGPFWPVAESDIRYKTFFSLSAGGGGVRV
jgi:hypothetical protein